MLAWLRLPVSVQGLIFVGLFFIYWLLSEAFQLVIDHCGHVRAVASLREWWLFGDMPALEREETGAASLSSSAALRRPATRPPPPPPPAPEPLPPGFLDFDDDLGIIDTVENLQKLRLPAPSSSTKAPGQGPSVGSAGQGQGSATVVATTEAPQAVAGSSAGASVERHEAILRRRAVASRGGGEATDDRHGLDTASPLPFDAHRHAPTVAVA